MAGKRKKRVRLKVKNLIILLLIFSFVLLMGYCFIMMPIDNIYINGNEILSDDEIMDMVSINDYPSFILANRFKMKKILLDNSYVDNVTIKKKYGNIIEFEIIEHRVVASNKDGKIILSSGEVIDNAYGIYDIPLLVNEINNEEVYKLFVTKMRGIDKDILRQVSEIEYSPVDVDSERFLFYMSDKNLVHVTLTKLNKIDKYNKIKDKLNGKKGIIYLDSGDFVSVIN